MSYITKLREAITQQVEAKANGRAAGEGLWSYYVRATMSDNPPATVDAFDERHTALMADLEKLRGLSKEEKSSVASAKCIIKKAVGEGIDVWKRDATGKWETNEQGEPMPRGKSDLQNAKSDYEKVMAALTSLTKKLEADEREPFTKEQLDTIAGQLLVISENVMAESKRLV